MKTALPMLQAQMSLALSGLADEVHSYSEMTADAWPENRIAYSFDSGFETNIVATPI